MLGGNLQETPVPLGTIPAVLSTLTYTDPVIDAEQACADLGDRHTTLTVTMRSLRNDGHLRLASYVSGLIADVEQRLTAAEIHAADLAAATAVA